MKIFNKINSIIGLFKYSTQNGIFESKDHNIDPESRKKILDSIASSSMRNLIYLSKNIQIVFKTHIIFASDSLRTLRRVNKEHIGIIGEYIINNKIVPPLMGYIDLKSLIMRQYLITSSSHYVIGCTLKSIENKIDDSLRLMNENQILEKEFRESLIKIRDSYFGYSEEYLKRQHCSLLQFDIIKIAQQQFQRKK